MGDMLLQRYKHPLTDAQFYKLSETTKKYIEVIAVTAHAHVACRTHSGS